MSHSQDARHRRVGTGFSRSGQRTVMGYWAPLALTVGIAAIGVAAWIWTERNEEDDEDDRDYPRGGDQPATGPGGVSFPRGDFEDGEYARMTGVEIHGDPNSDASVMARMQGALRRTPSPQQIFDGASKRVAAGVAAAGAFVGGALTSIREENRGDFEDHSRWSEEVESRNQQRNQPDATLPSQVPTRGVGSGLATSEKKRKTVVVVVSSESSHLDHEDLTSDHVVCCRANLLRFWFYSTALITSLIVYPFPPSRTCQPGFRQNLCFDLLARTETRTQPRWLLAHVVSHVVILKHRPRRSCPIGRRNHCRSVHFGAATG